MAEKNERVKVDKVLVGFTSGQRRWIRNSFGRHEAKKTRSLNWLI